MSPPTPEIKPGGLWELANVITRARAKRAGPQEKVHGRIVLRLTHSQLYCTHGIWCTSEKHLDSITSQRLYPLFLNRKVRLQCVYFKRQVIHHRTVPRPLRKSPYGHKIYSNIGNINIFTILHSIQANMLIIAIFRYCNIFISVKYILSLQFHNSTNS